MGTIVYQEVNGINAENTAGAAAEEISRLENLWSVFKPDSEVSQLRVSAGRHSIKVSPDTYFILSEAKRFYDTTLGAFDITVLPLVEIWGKGELENRAPTENSINEGLQLNGFRDMNFGPGNTVFLNKKGQGVDLGGIGKGYAADCCKNVYIEKGIRHAILNIGGNVLVHGCKPDGSPWRIGIRKPDGLSDEWMGYIEAENCSVVTSGSYERYFVINGCRYSHIIDPITGLPIKNDISSVTIISVSSTEADALATACYVLGAQKSLALIEDMPGVEALIIDNKGAIHITAGIKNRFHFSQSN